MEERRLALIVLAVALVLRFVYLQGLLPVLETRQTPVYGDAAAYHRTAAVILHREPIAPEYRAGSQTAEQVHDAKTARHTLSIRGPGYVLFLTAVFALFGEDHDSVRTVQAVLGARLRLDLPIGN